jgi:hypothetical protein
LPMVWCPQSKMYVLFSWDRREGYQPLMDKWTVERLNKSSEGTFSCRPYWRGPFICRRAPCSGTWLGR